MIRKPTATRAGVAAWDGTIVATGVRNRATAKSAPVTTFAKPVRAPSPTPAVDSTKQVVAEEEAGAAGGDGDAVDEAGPC